MEFLQLLQGSHLNNFPLKALKLGWIAYHSIEFRWKCLDLPSNQYRKLAPVLSRFCNGLCAVRNEDSRYEIARPRARSQVNCACVSDLTSGLRKKLNFRRTLNGINLFLDVTFPPPIQNTAKH